jgi:hypothetical protein
MCARVVSLRTLTHCRTAQRAVITQTQTLDSALATAVERVLSADDAIAQLDKQSVLNALGAVQELCGTVAANASPTPAQLATLVSQPPSSVGGTNALLNVELQLRTAHANALRALTAARHEASAATGRIDAAKARLDGRRDACA